MTLSLLPALDAANPSFPTNLPGLTLDVKRGITYNTTVSKAASGRETAATWQECAIITFEINYEYLSADEGGVVQPQDGSAAYTDLDTLTGFFQARQGQLQPFLLRLAELTKKPADSMVQGQQIGIGDGTTTQFQLFRQVGNFFEPIQCPVTGSVNIYVNGAPVTTGWTLGTAGVITFASAPAASATISADFEWNYLCRFDEDSAEFNQFLYLLHECQTLKLRTVIQ
jgi:uncharacterized protein (TIGR02217 family)